MNDKRIRELYLVASEHFKIAHDQGLPVPYQTRSFSEKFAELIVKECVGIVNSLEQYEGQGDCSTAEYIKEHFGVN